VDLQDFRFAGVDADLGKDGHQLFPECCELLPRIPDLADSEASTARPRIDRSTRAA
jgi:hypothetical protein